MIYCHNGGGWDGHSNDDNGDGNVSDGACQGGNGNHNFNDRKNNYFIVSIRPNLARSKSQYSSNNSIASTR